MNIDGNASIIRVDSSRVSEYIGKPEKPSFWDRIKKGLSTMGSFAGTMAQFVGPLFGPFGILAGAAGYGLKNVSNRALGTISSREQYDLATHQPQSTSIAIPGFMDGSSDIDAGFVAPTYLAPDITNTVIQSGEAQQDLMHSL